MSIRTDALGKDVVLLSLSAFFADAGYQALIAGFPIFLVLVLHAPVYVFGIATALSYGIGSLMGYFGGIAADRYGRKRVALFGNLLIPLLSFTGLASNSAEAVSIFSIGWWFRNFRSPARRAMLTEASSKKNRGKAFGFMHALDIGGGIVATTYLIILVALHVPLRTIFIITIIPLLISSLCLALVKVGTKNIKKAAKNIKIKYSTTYKGVIIATALYGFSYYSLGFPILTIAQASTKITGIGSYMLYLAVSALIGYFIGKRAKNVVKKLGIFGYVLSGVGTFLLGVSYMLSLPVWVYYIDVATLGASLGVVETFEPTIISLVNPKVSQSRKMGALTASRSLGLFVGNLVMGLLYMISPFYSYSYAAIISISAGIIILFMGRDFKL